VQNQHFRRWRTALSAKTLSEDRAKSSCDGATTQADFERRINVFAEQYFETNAVALRVHFPLQGSWPFGSRGAAVVVLSAT
jgi:hypothetical protein